MVGNRWVDDGLFSSKDAELEWSIENAARWKFFNRGFDVMICAVEKRC